MLLPAHSSTLPVSRREDSAPPSASPSPHVPTGVDRCPSYPPRHSAVPVTSTHHRHRAPSPGHDDRSTGPHSVERGSAPRPYEPSSLASKHSLFPAGAGGGHNRSILVLVNDGSAGSRDREATCHVEHAVSRIQRMIDPRSRAPARSLHGGKRGSGSGRRFGQEPRSPRKIPW